MCVCCVLIEDALMLTSDCLPYGQTASTSI